MICPKCQRANPAGAKFCIECGQPLLTEIVCPGCGENNPPESRFCQKCGLPLTQSVQQLQAIPTSDVTSDTGDGAGGFLKLDEPVKYAGFWKRLAAFIIDLMLLTYIGWVLSFVIGYLVVVFLVATDITHFLLPMGLNVGFYTLVAILTLVYHVGSWALDGQTLGKMAVGVRVVRVDGRPLGIGWATVRFIGYTVSVLTLCTGFLLIAAVYKKQGLHDVIAGTSVIEIRQAKTVSMTHAVDTRETGLDR